MISKLIIAIVSLAMPLAIFGQTTSSAASKPEQQLSNSDKAFLKAIIQEDISEIGLAQMALQKSSDPQVKQYAQAKILGADPEMRDRADQIAQQSGMAPPTTPNAMQESIRRELSGESGKSFDKSYMVYEASQQSADASLMDREIKSTNNPTVKAYANDEQKPVVQAAASAIQVNKAVASELIHYRRPGATTIRKGRSCRTQDICQLAPPEKWRHDKIELFRMLEFRPLVPGQMRSPSPSSTSPSAEVVELADTPS